MSLLPASPVPNKEFLQHQVPMGKSKSSSSQIFKDKAKNRVDDLQEMVTDLQLARKESRTLDIAVLEDRVLDMLREWKAELGEASPASSQNDRSLGSLSSSLCRILQNCDEKDDATSPLAVPVSPAPELESNGKSFHMRVEDTGAFNEDCSLGSLSSELRRLLQPHEENDDAISTLKYNHESNISGLQAGYAAGYTGVSVEDYSVNKLSGEHGTQDTQYIDCPNEQYFLSNSFEPANRIDYDQIDFHHNFSNDPFVGVDGIGMCQGDNIDQFSGLQPHQCRPSTAFLGPKCALWDCSRPAQGSDWGPDHCSSFHANLAWNEGSVGMTPILRPGGIGLKDGPLFSALSMKIQGKNVGVPECEGAATKKSPWNSPELFDITFIEGERLREWLFFDKPRKAFDGGNRKQRSLPDYNGRGWHASRRQAMKEHGGVKKSYYMDPQPSVQFEWHLYEYEIDKQDAFTLYRLELKLSDEKKSPKEKKSPRGKITQDSLADLQKQMGKLSAEFLGDKSGGDTASHT